MDSRLKAALKRLRAAPPVNAPLTAAARLYGRWAGGTPEWLIRHLPKVGRVRRVLPNGRTLTLWSRGDDWIATQVYWRGWRGYEPESALPFFALARQARVTLDVGAHVGFYALLAGHANPAGRVYAFEPLASAYERLRRNVAYNGLANVECVPYAASDAGGAADFYHARVDGIPSSSSLSYEFMRSHPDLTRSTVQAVTLDGFLRERGVEVVDLLKIDTESTEPAVLRGLRETLARCRPAIVCEVLAGRHTGAALEALLGPLGYSYYLMTGAGLEPRRRIEGHPDWFNYLFSTLAADELRRRISATDPLAPGPT